MIKIIKQLYNNIIRRVAMNKEKRVIFNETQKGDMLWCNMPLPKKQLKEIEESHRVRPYLVVEKGQNFLLCYQSSSKNREELNNYQKYFINGKKYRNKKDSWIDLTEVQKIKIKNIKSPYIKLSQIDIKKIEKRIWISQNRGNSNLIRFNEPIHLEIGDVVEKDEITYYIYSEDNVNIYGFKIQKRNKEKKNLEQIRINRRIYYTNFKELKTINRNDIFDIINIASEEEIITIFNKKSARKLKPDENIDKILKDDKSGFEIGSVFKYGNSTAMFLYYEKGKYYGVDLLWYKIKPRIFVIKDIKKRKLIGMKNLEDINKILEFFVEINIQNNTIKKIYQHVRNLLYSSIA